MSLRKERMKQFVEFKSGTKQIASSRSKTQQLVSSQDISPSKPTVKSNWGFRTFTFLMNIISFSGIWILPLLHLAGLTLPKHWLFHIVVIGTISFGNFNLLILGKRNFNLWDIFTIVSLTDAIWKFEEE